MTLKWRERVFDGAWILFAFSSVFSVSLGQAAIVLMVIGWLLGGRFRDSRGLRLPMVLPFVAFLALSVVSAIVSEQPGTGLKEIRSEWFPLFLLVAAVDAVQTRARLMRVLRWWFAAGALSGVLGVVQYLAPGILTVAMTGTGFRIRGTVGHYMTYAGLMLLVGLLALALLLYRERRGGDRWFVLTLGLSGLALMLTQTRGAWIGFFAGVVFVVWCRRPVWLWFLPLAAILLVLIGPREVRDRASTLLDRRNATTVERVYLWHVGLGVIADHPWTGIGPDQLERVYPQYRHPDDPWLVWRKFTHLHNTPLQVAAERGLPALVAWIWLWVVFLRHAHGIYRGLPPADRVGRGMTVGAMACIIGFLVAGLFEYNFGDSEVAQVVGAILALPFVSRLTGSGPETDGVTPKLV